MGKRGILCIFALEKVTIFMLQTDIPAEFAAKMRELPELDAEALLKALSSEPCVGVRLNNRKMPAPDTLGYDLAESVTWCEDGYYLPQRPLFTLNPSLHAGGFYVQDPSSMIHQQVVGRIVAANGHVPMSLLDFCGAPGGKTTAMINALPDGSVVVANEYVPTRGKILRENLEKWGYPAVITTGAAASDYAGLPEMFDIIAVDAPCSGEGMMRKEEEARRQWTPRLVEECAALQRDILSNIVSTLRPGGYLIYSTCTFNPEEDELNSRFIRDELGLEPVSADSLGLAGIENVGRSLLPDVEALRFMPHLTRGEGLYLSVFRKPGKLLPYLENEGAPSPTDRHLPEKPKDKSKGKQKGKQERNTSFALTDEHRRRLYEWYAPDWDMQFEQNGNLITALPAMASRPLAILRQGGVRVTGAGLPAAELKGRDLIPDSRIVLSSAISPDAFPKVALTEEEALRYLRRDAIQLPEGTPKGYVAVTCNGLPLGLMKNIGNRANNLFPAPWRIRI